jgi:hypothetical protein
LGDGFVLRVHRIQTDHLTGHNRGSLQQLLGGWNFIALIGHRFDSQTTVGRQTDGPDQMHATVFDRLAIDGH